MTIPFTPDEENPFPSVGSSQGFLKGAAFSALNNRTQDNVTAMLKSQVQDNDAWTGLWELFWDFIRQPFNWVIDIFKVLFPWVDWENLPTEFAHVVQWIKDALYAIPFFGDFIRGAETFIEALIRNLVYWITHPGELWNALVQALQQMFAHAGELIQTVISSILYWLTHPGELLTGIINFLKDVFGQAGELLQHVIEGIIYWITHPGQPGGLGYLLIEAFKTLFINGGALVQTVINTLVYWMQNAGAFLTALIQAIINWLKTVGIDLTGGLSFMQTIVDNVARFFGQTGETLWAWAQNLVSIVNLPALVEGIINSVTAVFNIGQVNVEERKNLLNMGVFQTSSTLEAVNGWSWDSGKNRTGTVGGSAKVTCTSPGVTRTLYSNQNIRVASGDRIGGSAFINTSGFNGGSGSIQLVLIKFAGSVNMGEQILAQSGASNNAWNEISTGSSPYEIPKASVASDQITSVQVALRVTSSASAGSVWWDDITLWKTGYLKQNLVEYLVSAWNGLIGGLKVQPNGTAQPANTSDPWNWTLQAGADARSTANTAAANAGTAKDAADAAAKDAGDALGAAGDANDAAGRAETAATNADNLASSAATANNLVLSPDFEDSTIPRTQYWLGVTYNFSYSSEQYKNGSQSLKMVAANAGSGGAAGGVILSSVRTDVKKNWIPVAPGQIYYFDIMYYGVPSANSNSISLVMAFNDINGSSYSLAVGNVPSMTKGSWQRLKGSYTIPANVQGYAEPLNMIPALVIGGTTAAGDTYYIDRAIIYR